MNTGAFLRSVAEVINPSWAPDRALPPMDGGFAPNDLLDGFDVLAELSDPQDAVAHGDRRVCVTAGQELVQIELDNATRTHAWSFPGPVTGLVIDADTAFVTVSGKGIFTCELSSSVGAQPLLVSDSGPLTNLSSIAVNDGRLYVTSASTTHGWADWPHDLMTRGTSGGLHEVVDGRLVTVSEGLAWPFGLAWLGDGRLIVSESWRHRLVCIDPDTGETSILVDRLPAYPSRIHPDGEGSMLVAFFALRSAIVEFVLREDRFRTRMLAETPVDDWIRPAYRTRDTVREPLQFGRAKQLGRTKPWAPPRSYGLVAELDCKGTVLRSYQSRPGATRHGVTAACRVGDSVVAVSRGSDRVLVGARRGEQRP